MAAALHPATVVTYAADVRDAPALATAGADFCARFGAPDIVMDPSNPRVLLAATHQRRRHVWTLINGGPESAIYKSTDSGATWRKITAGLPDVDKGRIGMAVSPVDPNIV